MRRAAVQEQDCPADETCHRVAGGPRRGLHGKAVSMADIAAYLENWTDRPVIDRTGVSGLYEIDTDPWPSLFPPGFPPGPPPPPPGTASVNDPVRPSLFTVLARIGLKLVTAKADVDAIVIEHIERPTPN